MDFFLILVIIFSIFLSILAITLIILNKIKRKLSLVGLNNFNSGNSIKQLVNDVKESNSTTPKSVVGMTSLVEPLILKDFPSFNKDLLFSLIESNLSSIFSQIENLKFENFKELELVNNTLDNVIEDLKKQNAKIKYDNIVFHRHALSRYEKMNGVATITTSSTLEFDYYDSREKIHNNYKTQTRYTCKYIYIYDLSKIPKNSTKELFIFNCPNCGAPVNNLENAKCEYCNSHLEEINLKTWKLSYFKNDYN